MTMKGNFRNSVYFSLFLSARFYHFMKFYNFREIYVSVVLVLNRFRSVIQPSDHDNATARPQARKW